MIGAVQKNNREQLQVSLGEFGGHTYIDVRTYFTPDGGETFRPSQKGCTLKPSQVGELIRLLRLAEADAMARGLIGGGE